MFAVAGLTAAAWLPMGAQAQQEEPTVSEGIQEITVTARRREESLQEVPIAITAMGGEELESRGVESIQNLNATVPNVSVMGGGATGESQGSFVVRGIPGVSTYIDGIWQATTDGLFTLGVVEVERIEVLRGPQGTLFGKNAIGGAIQYVTKRPGDTFGARISATGGSYNRRDVQASIDLPLSDTLKTKITGASLTRDGFIQSLSINRKYGDVNDEVIRGDLLWTPTDAFELRFSAEESDVKRDGPARVLKGMVDASYDPVTGRNTNPRAQAFINAGFPISNATRSANYPGGQVGKYQTYINWENPGVVTELQRYTLDMGYDVNDWLRVRSLTGYREHYRAAQTDFDGMEVTIIERDFRSKGRQITQELQFLGTHEKLDWVLGGYYWRDPSKGRTWTWLMSNFHDANLRARALAGGQGVTAAHVTPSTQDQFSQTETEGVAAFGDITWRATDQLTIAAGLRWNSEDLRTGSLTPVVAAPQFPDTSPAGDEFAVASEGTVRKASFSSVTPRLTVQYQWTPDIMTYAGFAEGFGAGGITVPNLPQYPDIPEQIPFQPEELTNYELGLRADWLGGTLRTNLSAFYSEYEGIQVSAYLYTNTHPSAPGQQFQLPNLYTTNAGAAEVKGVEFEGTYMPIDRLRIGFAGGWLDAKYTEVGNAVTSIRVGSKFQQAPEYTGNLNVSYEIPLSKGILSPRIDYTYTDTYRLATEDLRQTEQKAFGMLNARLTYSSDSNWSVSAFGTNLTNEYYLNSGFYSDSFLLDFVTIGRPREYGVTVNFTFQ